MDQVPGFSGHVTRNQTKKRKLDEKLNEQKERVRETLSKKGYHGTPGVDGYAVDQNLGKILLVKTEITVKQESTVDDMQNLTETPLNDDNDALSNNLEYDELPVDEDPRVVVVKEEIDFDEMDEGDDGITGTGEQDAAFQSASSEPNLPSTFLEDFKTQLDLCRQDIRRLKDMDLDKDVSITELSLQLKSAQAEIQRIKELIPGAPTDCGPAGGVARANESKRDERAEALLPSVVEVYWKWLVNGRRDCIKNLNFESQNDDSGIQIRALNSQKGIIGNLDLKCRQVCKQWKTSIDIVLASEETPLKNIFTKVNFSNGDTDQCRKQLTMMLNAYKTTDMSVCPFPPRMLVIIDKKRETNWNESSPSRKIIACFLRKFGDYLEEFQYLGDNQLFQDNEASPSEWYEVLTDWIAKMRNLKQLTLRNSLTPDLTYTWNLMLLSSIDRTICIKPFPELPELESFTAEHIPTLVIKLVLGYNSHLRRVRCGSDALGNNFFLSLQIPFPNLRSISCYSFMGMSLDFELGPKLVNTLENLELDYTNNIGYVDFCREFPFVQRFDGKKLQSLHLKLSSFCCDLKMMAEGQTKRINSLTMPNLKSLTVTFGKTPTEVCPLDMDICWTEKIIVQMCSSLKSLEDLTLYNLNSQKLGWEQDAGKLKRWELKKLLRIGMVSELFGVLSVLKMVKIQLAPESDATAELKSFSFLRQAVTNNVTVDEQME